MFNVNPLAEDSHEISSLIFSEKKNNEKIFENVVCCSRDWRLRVKQETWCKG